MAKRISEEAAQVVGFSEAIKKTAADTSKSVVDFDPDFVGESSWDAVITNLDQVIDLAKRAKTAAIEAKGQCQPELKLAPTTRSEPAAARSAAQ